MKSPQEEQREYEHFMGELIKKGQEVQNDFANLSAENKKRVCEKIGRYMQVEGLVAFLQNVKH